MKKLIVGLLILLIGRLAYADVDPSVDIPANRAILQKVETAYNKMKTIQAQFAQFNSKVKDDLQTGELYLSKPGKLRLVYQKGSPLEFYANNGYLIYHDRDLKEVSYFDLDQTPVSFILKETLRFDDPAFLVTGVSDILDEYQVTVIKKEAPELGSLTLIIDKGDLSLKQWEVVDMQGIKSTVSLYNIRENVPIDNKLFIFSNPYTQKN